ncbi:hypothetical protein [Modestobacter marinus]|uniref:hypothetical protein n=1 Tax=Modestobacter marinus TaxID=477641 RepID=UPI0021BBBEC3|nr:hypothetical protein [Modestobacter marinus]
MSEPGDRQGSPPTDGPAGEDTGTHRPTEVLGGAERDRQETLVVPPWSPPRHEEAGFPQRPIWQPEPQGTGPQPTGPQQSWPGRTQPEWSDRPVVVRRADTVAGLLLLLAGFAAGISLLVVWVHGGRSGMDLVRAGVADWSTDAWRLWDTGSWQPLAVVLGGAALFLIGLLLYVPAHTHRFLGALALLVTVVAAAGVLVPLAAADWDVDRYAVGGWLGVAVAGLGGLGALKALMTGPEIGRRL